MQRRRQFLSAATIALMVAALGLSACDGSPAPAPAERGTTTTTGSATPAAAPLPPPEALTDVLYRLADTSIPADQKLGLVQYATTDDQAALENFGQALADSGFRQLSIQATELAWSGEPGNVVATVTIGTADDPARKFTFPMEFSPIRDHWQLTRTTADQLLQLGTQVPTPTPTR